MADCGLCGVATDTVAGARHIYHALAAALDVTSCKNRLAGPTRDVLLTVRVDGDFVAEIQIHQQRVLALKKLTHAPYEVARLPADQCPVWQALVSYGPWRADTLCAKMRLTPSYRPLGQRRIRHQPGAGGPFSWGHSMFFQTQNEKLNKLKFLQS